MSFLLLIKSRPVCPECTVTGHQRSLLGCQWESAALKAGEWISTHKKRKQINLSSSTSHLTCHVECDCNVGCILFSLKNQNTGHKCSQHNLFTVTQAYFVVGVAFCPKAAAHIQSDECLFFCFFSSFCVLPCCSYAIISLGRFSQKTGKRALF